LKAIQKQRKKRKELIPEDIVKELPDIRDPEAVAAFVSNPENIKENPSTLEYTSKLKKIIRAHEHYEAERLAELARQQSLFSKPQELLNFLPHQVMMSELKFMPPKLGINWMICINLCIR
jgi:hypothetical protein